ncbi:hypothetical protein NM208_g1997 [Fusarium decemcellulare]|uniref:Uncharacterized protein n=1 Tax=Fusarium decemcellulare TaxID=57161 RepID=A0ACC1SUN2_9HYPO|nr:hypothetical protein NM208_g1997 [Fusarium decemcellulare]
MTAPAHTSNSDVSPPRPDEEKATPSQNDQQGSMHDTKTPRSIHGWKWALSYMAMLSTTFLFALDNTIVADIQPAILNDLGQIELLPWIGTGFALGNMVILPWSKAYGIFSIRRLYIFNILVFEIGSALCGAAPNMTAMILGRVIAGVGGSGMYSGTLTYVALCTSMKERATYMAGSTAVWGIGTVLGPVVGGAFAESSASWRWGFYINLVVGAVFAPAYLFLFPSINPQPQLSLPQKLKGWDWPMTVAFLSGSTFLTMAISFGGGLYSWHSAAEIVFWTLSGVFFVTTIVLVKFHPGVSKENQLWPSHFLRMPVVMNMQLQVFLPSGIVLGDGPLDAGVRLLPLIITMVVVSMISGFLLPKTPRFSPWYIGGSALVLVGTALMYTIDENTPNANIYGYNILIGVGAGCYIVIGFTVVQSLVPPRDIANAVAVMTIAQVLGMVLCLSIFGTVFQNMAVKEVGKALPQSSGYEVAQLVAGTSSNAFRSLSFADKTTVITSITSAIRKVWLLFIVAASLSFFFSLPLASGTGLSRQVKELQARLERAEARLEPDNGTPVESSPDPGSLRTPSLIPPSSGLDFPPYEPVLDTTFTDMDFFGPQFLSDISADHFNLLDHSEHPHNFDERQFGQTQDPDTNNGSLRLNLIQFGGTPANPNGLGPSQDKTLKYEGKEQPKPSREDLAILYRFFFDFIYDSLPILCEARFFEELALEPDSHSFLALRNAVGLVSAAISPQHKHLQQEIYVITRKHLDTCEMDDIGESFANLNVFQALLFLLRYEIMASQLTRAWMTLGRAIRLASVLNLQKLDSSVPAHENVPGLHVVLPLTADPVLLEERRRAFWCLFILETYVKTRSGMPCQLGQPSSFEVNLPLPGPLNSSLKQFRMPFLRDAKRSHSLSSYAACVLMVDIAIKCFEHVDPRSLQSQPEGFWDRYFSLTKLIEEYSRKMDPHLAYDAACRDPIALTTQLSLRAVEISFHAAAADKGRQQGFSLLMIAQNELSCQAAAESILETVKTVWASQQVERNLITLQATFMAWPIAVAINTLVKSTMETHGQPTPQVIHDLKQLCTVLEHVEKDGNYWRVFTGDARAEVRKWAISPEGDM